MADRQGSHLVVERLASRLTPDTNRTIARFFWPETPERAQTLIDRVMDLDQREVSRLLAAWGLSVAKPTCDVMIHWPPA